MDCMNRRPFIVGEHPVMKEVFRLARRVARSDLTVNIHGETGTGKELLARFIHTESRRRSGHFVAVDCGMLRSETARSELFGHARGAFTGAHTHYQGLVARAHGGTLFLDEVGELDLDLQLQLLRLIQEGAYRRIGDPLFYKSDIRLITATHRNLEKMVHDGTFREDLYYRLHMVPFEMPPLRRRKSDVPLLVRHFVHGYRNAGEQKAFSKAALRAFERYPWPGNIRELENEIVRLMWMVDGEIVCEDHLPDHIRHTQDNLDLFGLPFKEARKMSLDNFMREYLHQQLLRSGGNVTRAAELSGVGRQYFQMRMAECGLRSKDYKK